MARKAPTTSTLRRLFALSGNECAFPDCKEVLINGKGDFIGQVCHIEAAETGGERFNKKQTDEKRRAFENLLLMCYRHHIETNDIDEFPVEALKGIKKQHEDKFINENYFIQDSVLDSVFETLSNKLDIVISQNLQTHKGIDEINDRFSKIESSISLDSSKIYSQQLKIALNLRKENKFQAAYENLVQFKKENWGEINTELKFKVIANLGVTLFDLGRNKEGAETMLELNNLKYETLDSVAYLCLAYAVLKDSDNFEKEFKKRRDLGTNNINLWLAFIYFNKCIKSAKEIHHEIPKEVASNKMILFQLSEVYDLEGNTVMGASLVEKVLQSADFDIKSDWQLLLNSTINTLSKIASIEKIQYGVFDEKEVETVKEAIVIFSRILEEHPFTEVNKRQAYLYFNRAVCYKILKEYKYAENDFIEAWRIDKNFDTLRGILTFCIERNTFDKCSSLLGEKEKLNLSEEERFILLACEARILTQQDRLAEAINILNESLEIFGDRFKLSVLDNVVMSCLSEKRVDLARPYAQRMINEYPDSAYGYAAMAFCYLESDDRVQTLKHLELSLAKHFDKRNEVFLKLQIINGYYTIGEFQKAIDCYNGIPTSNFPFSIIVPIIQSYYNLQKYQEVIEIILVNNESLKSSPYLVELLFKSYYQQQEFVKAEEVIRIYLKGKEDDSFDRFRWIATQFFCEIQEVEEAKRLISSMFSFEKFDLNERFNIAFVLIEELKMIDFAFEVAYSARLDFFDTPQAHELYVSFSANNDKWYSKEELFLSQVREESAVILINEKRVENIYFLSNNSSAIDGNIIRKSNALWGLLMNKNLSDEIDLPNSVGSGSRLFIKEIWSKNLFAFRQSLELIRTRFAGQTNIVMGSF